MRTALIALLLLFAFSASGQKMLLLERANKAKTTKYYTGDVLRFKLAGDENYWYERTISDILPESNSLMLDNYAVKLPEIQALKVRPKPIWRILGGAAYSLGATLTFATTIGKFAYRDDSVNAPKLYGIAAASLGTGWLLTRPRKLNMGEKHRLRIVEINFWQNN